MERSVFWADDRLERDHADAVDDQVPFELGECADDPDNCSPVRSTSVDVLSKTDELDM
jgi:hypothetical protein